MNDGIGFDDAVPELEGMDPVSIMQSAVTFKIDGQLSADGLRRLTALPFEVLITADDNGSVIMSTGTATRARHTDDVEAKERIYGALSIHTHPHEDGIIANAPSLSDIQLSETVNARRLAPRTEYIAHEGGIIVYCIARACAEARNAFYASRGVSISETETHNLRPFADVARSERVALVRAFCEDTKLIVEEAAWLDRDGVQAIVNDMNNAIRALKVEG